MNVSEEAKKALAQGFASIAKQFQLPGSFAPGVLLAAEESSLAIRKNGRPLWEVDRRDATSIPLVTLDPVTSTDLDQAFAIERDGDELVEAVSLQHRIGEILVAEVVDAEAGIIQTIDSAIRSKATQLHGVENGVKVRVRIDSADPVKRTVRLTTVS